MAPCIVGGLPSSIAWAPIVLQPKAWSIERRQLSMRYSMIVPAAITLQLETWPLGPLQPWTHCNRIVPAANSIFL